MTETKRLGRGLEALLGPVSREQAEAAGTLREVPIAQVRPNPYQPRTRFDTAALEDWIRQLGWAHPRSAPQRRRAATR